MSVDVHPQGELEGLRQEGRELLSRELPTRVTQTTGLTEREIAPIAEAKLVASFGERLRKAIKDEGVSLQQVATAAAVTRQTISNYMDFTEVGTPTIPAERMRAIAARLRIREEWLRTGAEPMRPIGTESPAPGGDTAGEARRAFARELLALYRPIQRFLEDEAGS